MAPFIWCGLPSFGSSFFQKSLRQLSEQKFLSLFLDGEIVFGFSQIKQFTWIGMLKVMKRTRSKEKHNFNSHCKRTITKGGSEDRTKADCFWVTEKALELIEKNQMPHGVNLNVFCFNKKYLSEALSIGDQKMVRIEVRKFGSTKELGEGDE